jgi:hypothetical protein
MLKFFDADPDSGYGIRNLSDPGSGMKKFGFGIRDKHPESATLVPTVNKKELGFVTIAVTAKV